jgi:hypothetical protein
MLVTVALNELYLLTIIMCYLQGLASTLNKDWLKAQVFSQLPYLKKNCFFPLLELNCIVFKGVLVIIEVLLWCMVIFTGITTEYTNHIVAW